MTPPARKKLLNFLDNKDMIARWDSSLSVLPVARVQFPVTAKHFKRFFSGWSCPASPSWASVAENGPISPSMASYNLCGHWGGRLKSSQGQTDRRWLIEKTPQKTGNHSEGQEICTAEPHEWAGPWIRTSSRVNSWFCRGPGSCFMQSCSRYLCL